MGQLFGDLKFFLIILIELIIFSSFTPVKIIDPSSRASGRSIESLKHIAGKLNQSARQVIAVGDGANDLDMLSKAGTGVALHAKPSVAEQCDVRINFGDLTSLLFIQGFNKESFII